jgi:hypothetical protein
MALNTMGLRVPHLAWPCESYLHKVLLVVSQENLDGERRNTEVQSYLYCHVHVLMNPFQCLQASLALEIRPPRLMFLWTIVSLAGVIWQQPSGASNAQ